MKDKKPTLFAVFESGTAENLEKVLNEFSTKNTGLVVISCNTTMASDNGNIITILAYKLY